MKKWRRNIGKHLSTFLQRKKDIEVEPAREFTIGSVKFCDAERAHRCQLSRWLCVNEVRTVRGCSSPWLPLPRFFTPVFDLSWGRAFFLKNWLVYVCLRGTAAHAGRASSFYVRSLAFNLWVKEGRASCFILGKWRIKTKYMRLSEEGLGRWDSLVKCLLHNHEDLSSDSQHPHKNQNKQTLSTFTHYFSRTRTRKY